MTDKPVVGSSNPNERITFRCKYPNNCTCCPPNREAFVALRADAERMQREHEEDLARMERAAETIERLRAELEIEQQATSNALRERDALQLKSRHSDELTEGESRAFDVGYDKGMQFGYAEKLKAAGNVSPAPETCERQLPYSELERYMYRMFEFGKTGNSASAQCECQALRIAMGWSGKGASYAPTLKAFVQLCAPHGKDWLTCPECAKAAGIGGSSHD